MKKQMDKFDIYEMNDGTFRVYLGDLFAFEGKNMKQCEGFCKEIRQHRLRESKLRIKKLRKTISIPQRTCVV